MFFEQIDLAYIVHGGIRHLENFFAKLNTVLIVHGGIRHLENS